MVLAMTSVSAETIADFVDLSNELEEEGRIQGQVRLYNVNRDERIEADPKRFLERTLLTEGLEKSLTVLRDSLKGDDPRGAHLLQGPFGTGKSHQMVVLYHCFNAPALAREEFGDDVPGLGEALPEDAIPITVSLQHSQPDELWEPFFDAVEYDPGSYDSGGFPVIETIKEAADGKQVAFFVDELERWFNTLDDDRKETTKGFLQALLECAQELSNIHVFLSVLQDDSEVHEILQRERLVPINMSEELNVRELIRHRLFDTSIEVDERLEKLANGYAEAYEEGEQVNAPDDLRRRIYETYPFHPELLDTLEDCYYARSENQAARGMLFLLSKAVLENHDHVDLITHGDLDPRKGEDSDVGTELYQLSSGIHSKAIDDLGRIEKADIPFGERILTTILLYSLRVGRVEMVGANLSDIIIGTFHRGDRISDIVRDFNRVDNGKVWYLHEAGGRYAIREERTISALISDERAGVNEEDALDHVKDAIVDIFNGGHPIVQESDLQSVPDTKQITVVINTESWTGEDVRTIITNPGEGREWRNALVFVQPTGSVLDTNTLDKAIEIEAARRVSDDETLEAELREDAADRANREENELRDRVEIRYGEILEGDDLLNDFEKVTARGFDAYGVQADMNEIAAAMYASEFNLRESVVEVAMDFLNRRDTATIDKIYEQFLHSPGNPIPEDATDVLTVMDELAEEPVLVHEKGRGFRDSFTVQNTTDTLVLEESVQYWQTEDIKDELEQRLSSGDLSFDDFKSELQSRYDIVVRGNISAAAEELAEEGVCVFVDGNETTDRPRGAMLRTDVDIIDAQQLRTRLKEKISEKGQANVRDVLLGLRETAVFTDVKETASKATSEMLEENYLIQQDYSQELPSGRNPLSVTLVPTVDDSPGRDILSQIQEMELGSTFSLTQVASHIEERKARSFLLQHLGSEDPAYVLESGSSNPEDWTPDDRFRIPGGVWAFDSRMDGIEELRQEWREKADSGDVTNGFLKYTLVDDSTTENIRRAVETKEVRTDIRIDIEPGQDRSRIDTLLDQVPGEATDIVVDLEFEQ